MILDPRNKSGNVDPNPNGWFVIIEPKEQVNKPEQTGIKGFSMMAFKSGKGHEIDFPMITRNKKLKKLNCKNGEVFLSHRDATPKKTISFFFNGHLDYMKKGVKRFNATFLTATQPTGWESISERKR